jgi:hypothetical protein
MPTNLISHIPRWPAGAVALGGVAYFAAIYLAAARR